MFILIRPHHGNRKNSSQPSHPPPQPLPLSLSSINLHHLLLDLHLFITIQNLFPADSSRPPPRSPTLSPTLLIKFHPFLRPSSPPVRPLPLRQSPQPHPRLSFTTSSSSTPLTHFFDLHPLLIGLHLFVSPHNLFLAHHSFTTSSTTSNISSIPQIPPVSSTFMITSSSTSTSLSVSTVQNLFSANLSFTTSSSSHFFDFYSLLNLLTLPRSPLRRPPEFLPHPHRPSLPPAPPRFHSHSFNF